jgi:hypothetical protein
MINDLTYALGLLEGNLGAEDVRNNWRRHIERMWLRGRAPGTLAREHVFVMLSYAAECYSEHRVAGHWKKPRERARMYFATDANGKEHFLLTDVPESEEAGKEAIEFLASFDPELAAQIPCAEVAALIPVWLGRRDNEGRRGKEHPIDKVLCSFFERLGFSSSSPEGLRRQRLAWERRWPRSVPRSRSVDGSPRALSAKKAAARK